MDNIETRGGQYRNAWWTVSKCVMDNIEMRGGNLQATNLLTQGSTRASCSFRRVILTADCPSFSSLGVVRWNTCKPEFRPRTRILLIRSSVRSLVHPSDNLLASRPLPLLCSLRRADEASVHSLCISLGLAGAGSGNLYGSAHIRRSS